jgi:hypothetical protein
MQVWSKSGCQEVSFALAPEAVFRHCVVWHYSWVTQTLNIGTPPHASQQQQAWTKSGRNEGHFTLLDETVLSLYLASHCMGVTQKSRLILPPHAPQRMQVWVISGSNEGHFALKAEPAFRPHFASNCNGVNQPSHVHSINMRKKGCNFGRNRGLKKGTLIFTSKNFSVPFSPHIANE